MEDAYTIGIRLLLDDSVSAGLASIQSELASVDQAIAGTTGRLAVLRATAVRPASPEAPVLPAAAARLPSGEAAVAEPPAPQLVSGTSAPAAPVPPLPPQSNVQDIALQTRIVPVVPGAIPPVVQPVGLPALSAAPVHPAPSLQPVIREAGAEPRPVANELGDPAIFAPRAPAPMLPAPLSVSPGLSDRDPGRAAVVAAITGNSGEGPPPPKARENTPVAAPVTAPMAAVATAAPVASVLSASVRPVASPPFQMPQIAAPQTASATIPRIAAAPAIPTVAPAVMPVVLEDDRSAFAPPASGPPIVSASAAIPSPFNAVSSTVPSRPATTPTDQSRSTAAERQQDGNREIVSGDIYLDGARLGRWMRDHLAREMSRPQAGTAAFDPTLSPSWPGALQGS